MPEPPKKFDPHPLFLPSIMFVGGILIETRTGLSIAVVAATAIILAAAAAVLRRSENARVLIALVFLAFGCLALAVERSQRYSNRMISLFSSGEINSGDPVEIEGTLKSPPEPTSDGVMLKLNVDRLAHHSQQEAVSGVVQTYVVVSDGFAKDDFDALELRYGSRVSIACELNRVDQYQNPGVVSRLELLDRRSIDAVCMLKSPLLIEKLGEDSVFLPVSWAYAVRQAILDQIRSSFSASTAGVLIASTLGNKYFLDKATADVFREGGTFHVLVISGLHITFIGGLLLLLVSTFVRTRSLRFLIVSAFLWSYTLAVGAAVPVVRASLMFTILLFSKAIYRQGTLLNSLAACVLILLAWRPSDVFDPSFQLTLVSVFAIVALAFPLIEKLRSVGGWMPSAQTPFPPNVPVWLKRFCETLYWNPTAWDVELSRQIWTARIIKTPVVFTVAGSVARRLLAYVFEGVLVSLLVQLCLLPFLIFYFHRITPISVVMNLWVGTVMALESFSALAFLALAHISSSLADPFLSLTEFFSHLLVGLPRVLVQSNWSSWRTPVYPGIGKFVYAIYFIPLCVTIAALWSWKPFEISRPDVRIKLLRRSVRLSSVGPNAAFLTLALAFVVVFHPFSAPSADGRLHVDFLDVGQGDSALVTFPDGTTMLIDGGGKMDFRGDDGHDTSAPDVPGIGEAVVSPVLWEKGYSSIDYILATHADADHIQGLTDVAKNFEIGEALFGRMPVGDPEFADLRAVLLRRGVPMAFVARGQRVRFGDAVLEVLYPRADESTDAPSDNDHSVVLRIVFGDRAFLLTGDIEQTAETDLVNGGGTLAADVVKIPHHGSRTSSTQNFISSVNPRYAIISVGNHSRFGHPHQEVVERWLAAGVEVLRTGQKGMVSVSTDGLDLKVSTFKP